MTQSSTETSGDTIHVLHLAYDDHDCASLTILANDVRFHVIADSKNFQKSNDKTLYYEFLDKLYALRDAEQRETSNTQDSKPCPRQSAKSDRSDSDSAVDLTADAATQAMEQDSLNAEEDLRQMLLRGMTEIISTFAPPNRVPEPSCLYEWYHGPTYFYSLCVKSGELAAELLEGSEELKQHIDSLIPRMKMPQYIRKIDVPWMNPRDLMVQSEVDFPEPAHPGQVQDKEGRTFFFKPVVPHQPGPTKREITLLHKIEKLELDIKVPKLVGFVSHEDSQCEAMGLLLSHIEDPIPLTKLLKPSIPEHKRSAWSTTSERYVRILHENNIVWGDAKADNFMVDKHDDLWIIDFGGSYTEGWVDPEINETVDGDNQGLQKVQEALKHPEEELQSHPGSGLDSSGSTQANGSWLFLTEASKRKRSDGVDGNDPESEVETEPLGKRLCEDQG
jgi:tRNA A-37 threonylcarbamoyl transferase component Bud32